jgi:replicative DNA helicase
MKNLSDLHLLKAFLTKKVYENFYSLVDKDLLAEQTKLLLREYGIYFNKSPQDVLNLDDFKCWFFHTRYPELSEFNRNNYNDLIENIKNCESFLVGELIQYYQGEKIWQKMQNSVRKEGFNSAKLKELIHEYERECKHANNLKSKETLIDAESVFEEEINPNGLQWRLHCLNEALPPLSRGDFVLLVACVGIGKTSFLASEVSYMAQQLEPNEVVLWLNNEGREDRILRRLYCATLERRTQVLIKDLQKTQEIYTKRMKNLRKVVMINISGYTLPQVRSLFAHYEPSLAVIDQVTKIHCPSSTEAQRLEEVCSYVREISNEYCPILGIAQASSNVKWTDREGNRRTKIWLDLEDIYNSKIGVQGAAETVIGIGFEDSKPNSRYIYVSKTKRGKEIKQEVYFDKERSLYLPGFEHPIKKEEVKEEIFTDE